MAQHVAIYARVSSARQDLASQLPDLQAWAASQHGEVRYYQDKFTGRTLDRPGWNKLQGAIDRGEVSRVAVWRLDRLGRTAKGLTALFADLTDRQHSAGVIEGWHRPFNSVGTDAR